MTERIKLEKPNPQIQRIREEIETLKRDDKFAEMSKAFRISVDKRLNMIQPPIKDETITVPVRVPLKQLLDKMDLNDKEKQNVLKGLPITLGSIMKASKIDNLEKLTKLEIAQLKLDDLEVSIDSSKTDVAWPNGSEDDDWAIYSYAFW